MIYVACPALPAIYRSKENMVLKHPYTQIMLALIRHCVAIGTMSVYEASWTTFGVDWPAGVGEGGGAFSLTPLLRNAGCPSFSTN